MLFDNMGKDEDAALALRLTLYAPLAVSNVPPVAESRAVLVVSLLPVQLAASFVEAPKPPVTFTISPS